MTAAGRSKHMAKYAKETDVPWERSRSQIE
jgi:hypothetical protein